jgi:hypothetical protein
MATLEEKVIASEVKNAKITIGVEDARRLRDELLRYRRENLRQAQRALEIAKLFDLIIDPQS